VGVLFHSLNDMYDVIQRSNRVLCRSLFLSFIPLSSLVQSFSLHIFSKQSFDLFFFKFSSYSFIFICFILNNPYNWNFFNLVLLWFFFIIRFGSHSFDCDFFCFILLIKLSLQLHPSMYYIILLIKLIFQLHPSIFYFILCQIWSLFF